MYISDAERSAAAASARFSVGDRVRYTGPSIPRRAGPSWPVSTGSAGYVTDGAEAVNVNGRYMIGVMLDGAPFTVYLPVADLSVTP